MPSDPVAAGRKGGLSKSPAKLAAAKRNGFQKRDVQHEEPTDSPEEQAADVPTSD
jgi:hypothetical protein